LIEISSISVLQQLKSDNIMQLTFQQISHSQTNTGYGYIKPGKPLSLGFVIDEFKENPDEKTVKEYVQKRYLWNSGIVLLSSKSFFKELKKISYGSVQCIR
jgi:mannose-1-phosphate guanylyltransferase